MNNVLTIAGKEFRAMRRNRVVLALALVVWLLSGFAAWCGWERWQTGRQMRARASERFLHEWEEQEANPHSAAHFGTYLFKPASVISIYENGLNTFLGNSYRVEAHVQHELNHAGASDAGSLLRFGELSVALVFQLLMPLLILLITFNAFPGERAGGTLRLLLIQGARPRDIAWGKIWGAFGVVAIVTLPLLLALAVPVALEKGSALLPLGLWSLMYLMYFFLFTALGVVLSSGFRSSNAALVAGIGCWVLLAVLAPRAIARVVESGDPLPSRFELNRNIHLGYQRGMNGEGSSRERYDKYLEETLKKYGVDSVNRLPVNFDGLSMQYGEDYQAKVYAFYAGQVRETIARQQKKLALFSLLNPFSAVQQLSMGLSGTDFQHHVVFHEQAQAYRNEFIRVLNMDLANSGSEYLSYDYKVGPDFFSRMKTFDYDPPDTLAALKPHALSALGLALWIFIIAVIVIPFMFRKLKV